MKWLCHQLGSREHFSIPRALHNQGALKLLQTDCWIQPSFGNLLRRAGQASLASRFHHELANAQVKSFTMGRLGFDLRAKLKKHNHWESILGRNNWFQQNCLPTLQRGLREALDEETVVFSYSYTARHLFEEAKKYGATCVLGQIDPGPQELRWVEEKCDGQSDIEHPPDRYWASWHEEVALADRIIVNSEWSRGMLVSEGVVASKIETIPLAYSPPQSQCEKSERDFPKVFDSRRPLRVLFLGQVIPRKGVSEMFEAIERLNDAPIEFHVAGPIGIKLHQRIKTAPNVHLYGPVARPHAEKLYRSCDVFLLPTHSDGFAITQLEALAQQLPVIVSRYCAQVIEHEKNGIYLEEVSTSAIEQALMNCLESPERLKAMSKHSFDWAPYSLESLSASLLQAKI